MVSDPPYEHILKRRLAQDQLVLLKYHGSISPVPSEKGAVIQFPQPIDMDMAIIGFAEVVEAAKQSGFPCPGRPKKHGELAREKTDGCRP
jgi:hypothetical protein